MSDPDALTIILEPLGSLLAALAGIHWSLWFSRLTSLLALAWRPLFLPLAILGRILFVVFAPVLYVGSFLVGVVGAVLGLIASLEPIYTFSGVAAVIGIIAGVILATTAAFITKALGLHDSPSEKRQPWRHRYLKDDDSVGHGSFSDEDDQPWLDTSPVRRRPTSGLLSQTIHEEDSSDGAL